MESAASGLPSLSAMSRIGKCAIGLTVDVDDTRMGFAMCSDVGKVLILPRQSPDEHRVVSRKAGAINPTHKRRGSGWSGFSKYQHSRDVMYLRIKPHCAFGWRCFWLPVFIKHIVLQHRVKSFASAIKGYSFSSKQLVVETLNGRSRAAELEVGLITHQ